MVKDNREVEIKVAIPDIKAFEKKVMALNPRVIAEVLERTIRFDNAAGDLEKKGVFVRVRSGLKNIWTVKKKIEEAGQIDRYFQRHEWEVEIGDLEMVSQMLKALGFDQEFIMEKYRKRFILPDAEITIDRLPFGLYAEIEADRDKIDDLSKKLGLDSLERITVTYWHLHDEYNKTHGLSERNIVFSDGTAQDQVTI
jgi:predicted adenylyl cyclase CyaB